MRFLSNRSLCVSLSAVVMLTLQSVAHRAPAAEVTVQNDTFIKGGAAGIQAGFVPGESAAVWLTSPCDGNIVALQVFWLSTLPGALPSLEDSITVFAEGSFPVPGAQLAILEGPVMTPGVFNEFRHLDENQTIPLIVPVTNGQTFVVSFKFFNDPDDATGPSVIDDQDGCQADRNAIDEATFGWFNSCAFFVPGDWVIRAVVDCGAQPGACCEGLGVCNNGTTAAACGAAGGVYQGDGSNCTSAACNEACCFMPSGCLDLTFSDCNIAGGFTEGPGTDCGTTVCFPTGACCDPDGSCTTDVDPTVCAAGGGSYQGNNAPCNGSCPQPDGACCLSGGGCLSLVQTDCGVIPNSLWAGAFTACPGDCTGIPVGACCNPDGTCDNDIAETSCTAAGGIFQGDPSTCDGTCPAPQGACCVGQSCTLETDADCTGMSGTWAGILTDCADGNANGVPDECEAPPCTTAADCADPLGDGTTDDVCTWWECDAGTCVATSLVHPSDTGRALGECPPDDFCNLADALHALTCFAGNNTCDTINIDAGGPLGDCAPDGFCNLADALHALTCFAGNNSCTCGPSPEAPVEPNVVGAVSLTAVSGRDNVEPGEEFTVRVMMNTADVRRVPSADSLSGTRRAVRASRGEPALQLWAYQLHAGVSGGRTGSIELVDITIEQREDFVFAGATDNAFDAFNVENGQMLAGLFNGSVAKAGIDYLATFTYRASPDAAGTFVVDILHDDADQDQTFLVGSELIDKIEVVRTDPAVVTIYGR